MNFIKLLLAWLTVVLLIGIATTSNQPAPKFIATGEVRAVHR